LGMLLGKMLRLDVSGATGYSIPLDNPFLNTSGALPEIWAYGIRNPWRFTFDRATGDMYMGDVGQNLYEEINFQPADSAGGENYGWNAYEATQVFNRNVSASNPVMPIAEYQHGNLGCSVTAGYVYRGTLLPDLDGVYFYSDYCSGVVWAAYRDLNGVWQSDVFLETGFGVSSFGEDETGELYIVDYSGRVLKFVTA
jgi:glucose/arabinose dehydrogenase